MSLDLPIKKDILITTPIIETWGDEQDHRILLGQWCNTTDQPIKKDNYVILEYYQNDQFDLEQSYLYLQALYERTLTSVSSLLNDYHNLNLSLRSWRIILGPWLLTYIPIIWDRWEVLHKAFRENHFDKTVVLNLNENHLVPSDFAEFNSFISNDIWNHYMFSEILKDHYNEEVEIQHLDFKRDYNFKKSTKLKRTFLGKLANFTDTTMGYLQRDYKVLFLDSYFNFSTLAFLSFKLKQLPRMNYEFKIKPKYPSLKKRREERKVQLNAKNDFEKYLERKIFYQIPIAYLEGFSALNNSLSKIRVSSDILFTANAHLGNDLFALYAAKHVERNKKLIVSQHGGSLKSHLGNIFDHQEKISDLMTVWHKPTLNNQIQLPPNKLIRPKKTSSTRSKYLLLVGFETLNYAYRIQAAPIVDNFYKDYDQKIIFAKLLDKEIFSNLRVQARNHGLGHTNSKDLYAKDLGEERISKFSSANAAFHEAKVIVSSYPMTSFTESMHSGKPSILLYNKDFWQTHPQFLDLIDDLSFNKILFFNPELAAEHINNIWNDPMSWWFDKNTVDAKEHFYNMCANNSKDAHIKWLEFFQNC